MTGRRRALGLPLLGAAIAVAAPLVLAFGLGSHAVRTSAHVLVAVSIAGAAIAIFGAIRARGLVAPLLALLAAGFAGLLAVGVLVLARVPQDGGQPRAGERAPEIALLHASGEDVRIGRGPRIVLFFRGVW